MEPLTRSLRNSQGDLVSQCANAEAEAAPSLASGRQEHTVGGWAVGVVRDLLPFGQTDQAQARAQSNDQIAHVTADTIASIPVVRTFAGGLVRAAILIDPHLSFQQNARSFVWNFAEGVALNQLSRAALPQGAIGQLAARRLGTGLLAETASHFTVGCGFGGIRAGFARETWVDKNGEVNVTAGLLRFAGATATGAIVNIPAGMIGVRLSRQAGLALSNETIGQRTFNVLSGMANGYGSGAVFGGVEGLLSGHSFAQVRFDIAQGALIGMTAGGVVGRFLNHRPSMSGVSGVPETGTVPEPTTRLQGQLSSVRTGPESPIRPGQPEILPGQAQLAVGEPLIVRVPLPGEVILRPGATVAPHPDAALVRARSTPLVGMPEVQALTRRPGELPRGQRTTAPEQPTQNGNMNEGGETTPIRPIEDGSVRTPPEVPEPAPVSAELLRALEYVPPRRLLSELSPRLTQTGSISETFYYARRGEHGPYADYRDFLKHLRAGTRNVLIYRIEGHRAEIRVPEPFARIHAQVRALRTAAERPSLLDTLEAPLYQEALAAARNPRDGASQARLTAMFSPEQLQQVRPILEARVALERHRYRRTLLPEDIVQLMDEIPDPRRPRSITLLNEECWSNPWSEYIHPEDPGNAAASARQGGWEYVTSRREAVRGTQRWRNYNEVEFYKGALDATGHPLATTRRYLLHEHAHLDPETNVFMAAANVERRTPNPFYTSTHSRLNLSENWADHRADFLSPEAAVFVNLARRAPLRTFAIADRLGEVYRTLPREQLGPYADQLRNRLQYVDEFVRPQARQVAAQQLETSVGRTQCGDTMLMFLRTGGSLADIPSTPAARHAAREGLINLTQRRGGVTFEQLQTMAEQGPAPVRELISEVFRVGGATIDPRAYGYGRYLQLAGHPDNVPQLMDTVGAMPDRAGKLLVFNELSRLLSHAPESQQSMARIMYGREPSLRPEALRILIGTGSEPRVIGRSVLHDIGRYLPQGEAIPLLLRLRSGRPELAVPVREALSDFPSQIVRFYARQSG